VTLFFCGELDLRNRWGVIVGLGSWFCAALVDHADAPGTDGLARS